MKVDLDAHHEEAWRRLPVDIRRRAVDRLRYAYDQSFFDQVKDLAAASSLGNWMPPFWHHGQGMDVRNVLRSDDALLETKPLALKDMVAKVFDRTDTFPPKIRDSELPDLADLYGREAHGYECRNWDDYYVQCVEAAAGLREIQ